MHDVKAVAWPHHLVVTNLVDNQNAAAMFLTAYGQVSSAEGVPLILHRSRFDREDITVFH